MGTSSSLPPSAVPSSTFNVFDTKHYLSGMDIAIMSEAAFIQAVSNVEQQIANLERISIKSDRITKTIKKMKTDLKKAVEMFDSQ